jgi:hypothetical protein
LGEGAFSQECLDDHYKYIAKSSVYAGTTEITAFVRLKEFQ